ncbi:MAG: T9SS type A sorting domain-containing protein, partial [Bacteroidota bacterium]|nr:T9SS type A sorting domain-containing protein [Bacteroidota bacterium]
DRGDCSFYPNPASSYVTVLCSDNHNVIEISNLAGRVLIRTNNNNNNKKKKKKKINVSFLSNGLYLIHSIGIDGAVHLHGKLIVSK